MNENLTAKLSKTTLKYIKICMDISSALTSEKKIGIWVQIFNGKYTWMVEA